LGVIAFLAIIGLVPLWAQVYRVYAAPGPPLAPPGVSLPDLQPGQVRMPSLQGLSETDAQEIKDKLALKLEVRDYQPDSAIRAFAIVRQSVDAGTPLSPGMTVYVTLSQGQDQVEVPDVVGLSLSTAEKQLTQAGFLVNITEVWSPKAESVVIEQDPPPNGMLAQQSVINLSVKAGPKVQVSANFGNQLILSAFELPRLLYTADDTVPLTLFWQMPQPLERDYEVLIEIVTTEGQAMAQYRGRATDQARASFTWLSTSSETIDPYQLRLPNSITPGVYQLRLLLIDLQDITPLAIIETGSLQGTVDGLIL
jgi:hypothetical protein